MTTAAALGVHLIDDAVTFVKENPGRYVQVSRARGAEREGGVVRRPGGGRAATSSRMLEHYKKARVPKIKVLQLQKFAHGVEVAVGAFLQWRRLQSAGVHQLRAQEDVQRRHRPADGRDGTSGLHGRARTSCSRNTLVK